MSTEDAIRAALKIREKADALEAHESADPADLDKPTLTAVRRLQAAANAVLGKLYARDREQQRR